MNERKYLKKMAKMKRSQLQLTKIAEAADM